METKELIQALRADAEWAYANEWETPITLGDHLDAAADALAAVTAERDAAVEDLTKLATKPITPCHSCSKTCLFPASLAPELQPATWCRDWEWRGTQKAEKGEAE